MTAHGVLVALGAVVAGVALVALAWPLVKRMAIYPGGKLAADRADPGLHGLPDSVQIRLTAEDGVRIHAWWTPARPDAGRPPDEGHTADEGHTPDGARSRGAVIYCHGNAESMATRAFLADRLARLGFDSLLFDYRGYGLSEGRASEEGLAMDARAAWRRVVEERGVAPDRVVLMGHSLGSAVATRLALEVQAGEVGVEPVTGPAGPGDPGPAALVVGAPFPDMPTLFAHHVPILPGFLLRWRTDRHAAGRRLGEVGAPVLVLTGTRDTTIPPEISRAVVAAAGEAAGEAGGEAAGRSADGAGGDSPAGSSGAPRVVAVDAEHGTLMGHPETWAALASFLGRVVGD